MGDKQNIISDVYFEKSGFGSKKATLDDAKQKDKTITMADINEFFRKNVEQKKQLRGYNSFVAPEHGYEYQVDLFFIGKKRDSDLENQKFKIGMVMIDIFSKYAVVIPISSKETGDIASGVIEGINKMGKKPDIIYTDDEGALSTTAMKEYFEKQKIKHIITRSNAWFAERFIRTFKSALFKRVENSKKDAASQRNAKGVDNVQWTDFIFEILLTYNNKIKHSATGFTPSDAKKKGNETDVKLNLLNMKKHDRRYPLLSIGDKVKIYRKKEPGEKERTSNWSSNTYEVETISKSHGQTCFKVEGMAREYSRHEILKV
jgi:hypothetical protein